ncbi:hypothetical protein MASR1M45_04600 [Candidatus Kapaibacterium sp.]
MPIKYLPQLSGNPEWGEISGDISSQNDLNEVLSGFSPTNHNHSLSSLSEKSYSSLSDKPDLSKFLKYTDIVLTPAIITDGIDDYLTIADFPVALPGKSFSLIMRAGLVNYYEDALLFDNLNLVNKSGFCLSCNYGIVKFSIGNGTDIYTANHSFTIEEGRIYQFAVSFDALSNKLIFSIDKLAEEHFFPDLGDYEVNLSYPTIGKRGASYFALLIHSISFIRGAIKIAEIIELFDNYNFSVNKFLKYKDEMDFLLYPENCSYHNWTDISPNLTDAAMHGGISPVYRPNKIVLYKRGIDEDITIENAIASGYSADYLIIINQSSSVCELDVLIDSQYFKSGITIPGYGEEIITINKMYKLQQATPLSFEFESTTFEIDIVLLMSKQLLEL